MEIIDFLEDARVTTFLLLLVRFNALITFLPFFNFNTIPTVMKGAFAFYLAVLTYTLTPVVTFEPTFMNLFLAVIYEATFGLFVGMAIYITFLILQFAGQNIAFVMGMTMANVVDPQSGMQVPVISQFFNIVAIVFFLAVDGHHLMIYFMADSLAHLPFGEFLNLKGVYGYYLEALKHFFILGLSISFPVLAISLLSDIIFGMIMKTMPQFNLLVIGFPIKIGLSFVVIATVMSSMMFVFKNDIFAAIEAMSHLIRG